MRCTYCRERVELIHGHASCRSPRCPLCGLDQSEPTSGADTDSISLADVLRASSPDWVPAVLEAP